MAVVLTERGQRMLSALPAYYWNDPSVLTLIDAIAREYDRIEAFLEALRTAMTATTVTDDDGLMSLWEAMLGLPVAPAGVIEDDRRSKILATLRSRKNGSGQSWVESVNTAIGTGWTHDENTPGNYQITITIPYSAGSYAAGRVEALIAATTPAHLEVVMAYVGGFRVGISRVGDAL